MRQHPVMLLSLIGTVHLESGLATAAELHAILERSQPHVIFAEFPPEYLSRFRDGSHGNLESTAVSRYLTRCECEVVAVDLAKPEQQFFEDAKDMFHAVERTSADYCRLMDAESERTRNGGFPYLNSDHCMRSWIEIYRELRATIEWIGLPRLRETYDVWTGTSSRRDRAMMRGIVSYSARSASSRGVFLVGAAHRNALIELASAARVTGSSSIEWDYGQFLNTHA